VRACARCHRCSAAATATRTRQPGAF
jgi:hypothetical protein